MSKRFGQCEQVERHYRKNLRWPMPLEEEQSEPSLIVVLIEQRKKGESISAEATNNSNALLPTQCFPRFRHAAVAVSQGFDI